MNGQDFLKTVSEVYAPFLGSLGLNTDDATVSGRHYRATFKGERHAVLVSYEPGDEVLFVVVFALKEGQLSDMDDREKTPRLSDLNRRYMASITSADRVENDSYFEHVAAGDSESLQLLKAARELRLVLPKYLKDADASGQAQGLV